MINRKFSQLLAVTLALFVIAPAITLADGNYETKTSRRGENLNHAISIFGDSQAGLELHDHISEQLAKHESAVTKKNAPKTSLQKTGRSFQVLPAMSINPAIINRIKSSPQNRGAVIVKSPFASFNDQSANLPKVISNRNPRSTDNGITVIKIGN